jgi:hypothetical protein
MPSESRNETPTVARHARLDSGLHSLDLSNVHEDESSSRAPWDDLVGCKVGSAELSIDGLPPVIRPLPMVSLDEAVTAAIGQWFGDESLRHWFAFRQLPVEAGRVRWRLDLHLSILGEDGSAEGSEAASERAAEALERLTLISMTIHTPRRDLRLRAPLLVPVARTERASSTATDVDDVTGAPHYGATRWLLRDMILRVHPLLVPDEESPATEPPDPPEDTLNERNTRTLAR